MFKKFYISFLLLLAALIALPAGQAKASHIVGGDFSLQELGNDRYRLTLKVFRDCENGVPGFNDPVWVGMFERNTHKYRDRFRMDLLDKTELVFVGDNCINIPTGCTEVGYYSIVITLKPEDYDSDNGYYFSWERCCRNVIIKNIFVGNNPQGNVSMAYYMEIPPLKKKNSTPVFNREPLTLLCIDNPFKFNYNVTDADGDSLVYSLVAPLWGNLDETNPNDNNQINYPVILPGPYKTTTWRPGYGLNYIIDGNPTLSINKHTGELNITPSRVGVYVVSILVEEFRDGEKLGEVRRELQFTITTCNQNTKPEISSNATDTVYSIYPGKEFCLDITSSDRDPNDSVYVDITGDIFAGSNKIGPPYATVENKSGKNSVTNKLCWTPTCSQATGDTLTVTVNVTDNGCPLAKSAYSTFRIVVMEPPVTEPPAMFCLERLGPDEVRINWGRFTIDSFLSHYSLMKRHPDGTEEELVEIRDFAITGYTDNQATDQLNIDYCYYLVAYNICGEIGDSTYEICTVPDPDSIPPPSYVIRATVENDEHVLLEWEKVELVDFYRYYIYKKTNEPGGQFTLLKVIEDANETSLLDMDVDVHSNSYCYRITVENQCGLVSPPGNEGCTILLTGEDETFQNYLDWNAYTEWPGGVAHYELWRKDPATGYRVVAIMQNNQLSYLDDQLNYDEGAYWYKVIGYQASDTTGYRAESVSNEVFLIQKPKVYVPNAFTPAKPGGDGDFLNDVWGIVPVFVKDFNIKVFNRWGQLVYESDDKLAQWDGTYKNNEAFDNVFVYILTYTGWDGSTHFDKGNVTTLRQ